MIKLHFRKILAVTLVCAMMSGTMVHAAETTNESKEQSQEQLHIENEAITDEDSVSEESDEEDIIEEGTAKEEITEAGTTDESDKEESEDYLNEFDEVMESEEGQESDENLTDSTDNNTAEPDEATQALVEEYLQFLNYPMALMSRSKIGTYESELAAFPSDYQAKLKEMHEEHPNWVFVAVDTGLDWTDVVDAEYSNTRSLLEKTQSDLLLSKASGHYDTSTGAYIPKDGSTWVTAAKQAVTYYVDPRNFLNENYVFMFEALDYNSTYHTLQGVKNILAGTQLANKKISYVNTEGKTVNLDITYEEVIYAAGVKTGVSPLFLASKVKQETGAKLTNGSISGTYSYGGKSYKGYYNYYNIGATSTATGSAVANGLSYASKSGSYSRPWTSPVLAIEGGAQFLAASYIGRGQNTSYFQKFNTIVKPYYGNQYMQSLTGAASEGRSNYNSYVSEGIVDNNYVFYVPVYDDMPSQTSKITISGAASKAKTTTAVNMRTGPSTSTGKVTNVPAGTTITIGEGCFIDETLAITSQLSNPYWFKVTYGSYTGYISARYLQMNSSSTIKVGGTKTLSVSGVSSGEAVYFDSSAPTIASVDENGKVKGLKEGSCTIYAISGSGKTIDSIGITVSDSAVVEPDEPEETKTYTKYKTTTKVNYRTGAGTSYSKGGSLASGTTIEVEDGYSKSANGYTWVRFKLNGKNYYIANEYIEKVITLSKPTLVSAKYDNDKVTVTWKKVTDAKGYYVYRKVSGGSWSKIKTISSGSTVTYTDSSSLTEGKTYIYTVKAYAGSTVSGYDSTGVSVKIPETEKAKTYTKYKTTTKVNYRTGAGTSYSKGGTLAKNKTIEVENGYSKKANGYTWYRFKLNGKNYYIASKYVKKVSTTTSSTTYTKYKTTTKVNYRTGAGTSYSKGGTLAKNKTIEVENGYSKKANGYTWYRFKMSGKNYYIASKYVKKA